MDFAEKMRRCEGYVDALEEERRKIQVFHRELPLCLELVTQAIDSCKQQLGREYHIGRFECSEQTSSDGPVLEEFLPLKRSSSSEVEEEEEEEQSSSKNKERNHEKMGKKADWLRSVQLWNPDLDTTPLKQDSPTKQVIETKKRGSGAFHPFHRDKDMKLTQSSVISTKPSSTPPKTVATTAATSSTTETTTDGGNNESGSCRREDKEGKSNRKSRRCWSPELHRRFLQALQQLGGSHTATPKQIRELMKVDGLTNDEVKSHLQKYRLHTRRPTQGVHNNGGNHQQPQFVVVGSIWVPPPEYSGATEKVNGAAANGIYAPVATVAAPPVLPVPRTSSSFSSQHQPQQLHSEGRGSRVEHNNNNSMGDDDTHSYSPATSSSTHTTTASPAF